MDERTDQTHESLQPSRPGATPQTPDESALRKLPSVDRLLGAPVLHQLVQRLGHNEVVAAIREVLGELRAALRHSTPACEHRPHSSSQPALDEHSIAARIAERLAQHEQRRLRPVVNATGILLHTGLGRAPLSTPAIEAIGQVARGYANVELDLPSGRRGSRLDTVAPALCRLCGAEAAIVVNNNAGATLLVLAALASGREVIVSRGELIEIGGSFRLPDVMAAGGALLREVGTTNKTRIDDYRQAIGDHTAALMQVHTSNYKIVGFTATPSLPDLARLARQFDLPLIHDIGSGALIDFGTFGFPHEPQAATSIRQGADVVLFSGDKLLGGPQCGVIVGRRHWLEPVARHPLMRALRVDKLTLAALDATLEAYRNPDRARREIPLLALLSTSIESLRDRAERLAQRLGAIEIVDRAEAVESVAYLGGGSVPTEELPTWCVAVAPRGVSLEQLGHRLRTGHPAIVGRVQQDRLLLDLRTVFEEQDEIIYQAFAQLAGKQKAK